MATGVSKVGLFVGVHAVAVVHLAFAVVVQRLVSPCQASLLCDVFKLLFGLRCRVLVRMVFLGKLGKCLFDLWFGRFLVNTEDFWSQRPTVVVFLGLTSSEEGTAQSFTASKLLGETSGTADTSQLKELPNNHC